MPACRGRCSPTVSTNSVVIMWNSSNPTLNPRFLAFTESMICMMFLITWLLIGQSHLQESSFDNYLASLDNGEASFSWASSETVVPDNVLQGTENSAGKVQVCGRTKSSGANYQGYGAEPDDHNSTTDSSRFPRAPLSNSTNAALTLQSLSCSSYDVPTTKKPSQYFDVKEHPKKGQKWVAFDAQEKAFATLRRHKRSRQEIDDTRYLQISARLGDTLICRKQ